jgi:CelD/BcsL family acetyltransferase involved in cellulose biosynthesis
VSACATAYADDADLSVVAVSGDGRLRAVAPLLARRGPLGRLEPPGTGALGEPTDFQYADRTAASELAQALVRLRRPIVIARMWRDSPMVEALGAAYRGRGVVVTRERPGCPYISLDVGWADPLRKLKARRRSDLRRARRRAEAIGATEARIEAPDPRELAAGLLSEALRIEASGWKGRTGTAVARDPRQDVLYRRYAAAAAEAGILRLGFLRIEGRAVAMQVAAECDGRLWLLKVGYDPEVARCSPGSLLMVETIRYAVARELRSLEFLGAEEPWTAVWTEAARPCVALHAYPARPRGALALAAGGIGVAARSLARRAPKLRRRPHH